MAIPSEAQPLESKNKQAIASLALGVVSLVLIFIIGAVGIVVGLLALVAGVRGLRTAKQQAQSFYSNEESIGIPGGANNSHDLWLQAVSGKTAATLAHPSEGESDERF